MSWSWSWIVKARLETLSVILGEKTRVFHGKMQAGHEKVKAIGP